MFPKLKPPKQPRSARQYHPIPVREPRRLTAWTHPETARILGTKNNLIVYIQIIQQARHTICGFQSQAYFDHFWPKSKHLQEKHRGVVAAGTITFEDLEKFLRGLVPGRSSHVNPPYSSMYESFICCSLTLYPRCHVVEKVVSQSSQISVGNPW